MCFLALCFTSPWRFQSKISYGNFQINGRRLVEFNIHDVCSQQLCLGLFRVQGTRLTSCLWDLVSETPFSASKCIEEVVCSSCRSISFSSIHLLRQMGMVYAQEQSVLPMAIHLLPFAQVIFRGKTHIILPYLISLGGLSQDPSNIYF